MIKPKFLLHASLPFAVLCSTALAQNDVSTSLNLSPTQLKDLVRKATPASFWGGRRNLHLGWHNNADCMPRLPPTSALTLGRFNLRDRLAAEKWLDRQMDFDNHLLCRLDGFNDEVGRVQDALRTRLHLHASLHEAVHKAGDNKSLPAAVILFDARCLQNARSAKNAAVTAAAAAALRRLRQGPNEVVLLIDPAELDLTTDIAGSCRTITHVADDDLNKYAALVQPSPMMHTPEPLLPLLSSNHVLRVTFLDNMDVVKHADAYAESVGNRAEYAARFDAMTTFYDHYIVASRAVEQALVQHLQSNASTMSRKYSTSVAVPSDTFATNCTTRTTSQKRLPRKTIGFVTGTDVGHNMLMIAGLLTQVKAMRSVYVFGLQTKDDVLQFRELASVFDLDLTNVHFSSDLDTDSLRQVDLVVVPSFTETLWPYVVQAVQCGTPVVASDKPFYRALLGNGSHLIPTDDAEAIKAAIAEHAGNATTATGQKAALDRTLHTCRVLEDVLVKVLQSSVSSQTAAHNNRKTYSHAQVKRHRKKPVDAPPRKRVDQTSLHEKYLSRDAHDQSAQNVESSRSVVVDKASAKPVPPLSHRLNIGIVSPWPPQMSGIAAFTRTTAIDLALRADVTVYVTANADSLDAVPATLHLRPVAQLLSTPRDKHEHTHLLVVLGNSHFHLPGLQVLRKHSCDIILHDTRLVDLYAHLRGFAGLRRLMKKAVDVADQNDSISLHDQLQDFNKLQNYGTWEAVRQARRVIMHAPLSSGIVARQTGVVPVNLPFASYLDVTTTFDKAAARQAVGFTESCTHISTFGSMNQERKRVIDLLKAVVLVARRKHPICMHFVGVGEDKWERIVYDVAQDDLVSVNITGFVNEKMYLMYITATDLGVQLRDSANLGPSGALADLSLVGTPGMGSNGIAVDTECPGFIDRLPQTISIESLANAIEYRLLHPYDQSFIDAERARYARKMSPARYTKLLLRVLSDA